MVHAQQSMIVLASAFRHSQAALQGAREGMVLLKNEGLLPIDPGKVRTIAVIGPGALPAIPTAGGSGKFPSFNAVSFLTGISHKLNGRVNVTYAPGLSSLRMMTMLSSFSTAASGGRNGVQVEAFDNPELNGNPVATRAEVSSRPGARDSAVTPDFLQILDTLPPGADADRSLVADERSARSSFRAMDGLVHTIREPGSDRAHARVLDQRDDRGRPVRRHAELAVVVCVHTPAKGAILVPRCR